jgi:predicted DNA-binding transcriptional regulator AlpA
MQPDATDAELEAAKRLGIAILEFVIAAEHGRRQRSPKLPQPPAPEPVEPDQPPAPKLLSARDAAKVLGISSRALFALTSPRGPIPSVRIGRLVKYSMEALESWIRHNSR